MRRSGSSSGRYANTRSSGSGSRRCERRRAASSGQPPDLRIGGSEAEAAAVYEEGRALAERAGDRRALALLSGLYGVMRVSVAGSALDYVRYGEEAARIGAECGDPALRAALGVFPTFGHFIAGDGRAALEWSARVLEEAGSDNGLGKEIIGFSPRAAAFMARVPALMCLGRLEEAWRAVREAERVAEESRELEVLGWTPRPSKPAIL